MKELVKSAGLSKGAFYHYFESKEQLFLAVLEYFYTSVAKHHYENYSKKSFYKFYRDYANEIKIFSEEHVTLLIGSEPEGEFNLNYFTLAFDALKIFPEFKSRMVEKQHEELKIWTDVIAAARKNGEITTQMSDEEVAQLFIYSSDGIAMHMVMEGTRISDVVETFMNLWDKLYEQIKT